MSVKWKIGIIIALGVCACLVLSGMNRYFNSKSELAFATSKAVEQVGKALAETRLAEVRFIQKPSDENWARVQRGLDATRERLGEVETLFAVWHSGGEGHEGAGAEEHAAEDAGEASDADSHEGHNEMLPIIEQGVGEIVSSMDILKTTVFETEIKLNRLSQLMGDTNTLVQSEIIDRIKQEIVDARIQGKDISGQRNVMMEKATALLDTLKQDWVNTVELFVFQDVEQYETGKAVLDEALGKTEKNLTAFVKIPVNKDLAPVVEEIVAILGEVYALRDEVYSLYTQRREIVDRFGALGVQIETASHRLAEAVATENAERVKVNAILGWLTVAVAAVVLCILGAVLGRSIAAPLADMAAAMDRMAVGDFSRRVEYSSRNEMGRMADAFRRMAKAQRRRAGLAERIASGDLTVTAVAESEEDVLGRALIAMTDNLNGLMGRIRQAADGVGLGAEQISDSSQDLSQRASEQAASLEQISSSMTQLGSQTRANAEHAGEANNLSAEARNAARQGKDEMAEMVTAMAEISDSSQAIARIIKVIDEIAFQTNLLALNAAVEAARAGRHGKGFAVVAEEVRNLAGRSAKAARETAELIERSLSRVERGESMARETAEALDNIVDKAVAVADLVGEIAAASTEQAEGISQINQGLHQMEDVTQHNTATAEETASMAGVLTGQAEELRRTVAMFQMREDGASGPAPDMQEQASGKAIVPSGPREDRMLGPEQAVELDDREFGKY